MGSSVRRMMAALAAALLAGTAAPAPASAVGTSSSICSGTVTVGYSPPLTLTPSTGIVSVTLNQATLACVGPATHTLTVSATGSDPIGASCTNPTVVLAGGSLSTDTVPQISVTWAAVGTPSAQLWAFSDTADVAPQLAATGPAAWVPTLDGAGVTPCTSASVSAVTLTAVLVLAA